MLATLFSTEKKPAAKVPVTNTINTSDQKLRTQNERLKKQIDMLYQVLVDKEATVFKLKKLICDELKKPEHVQKYYSLEDQLNKIFHQDDDYDPRQDWTFNNGDASLTERINTENGDASLQKDSTQKFEQASSEASRTKKTLDTEKDLSDNSPTLNGLENIDPFSGSDKDKSEDVPSPCILSRTSIEYKGRSNSSISQKSREVKRVPVNPMEQNMVTRRLFNFELELKEYSASTFDAVKRLIAKKNLTADEIHDAIEELAENAAKQKYFKKIFPADTTEKVADELENYVFEVLYPKLYIVDDDIRGRSHQFQDRLNVLKSLVTFEMLEIPEELRREGLYSQAINELKKINQFKAPGWKIQCLQNCVNYILNVFGDTVQRSPSSDELFPVLVYAVIHANVDLLQHNVDYIYNYLRKCHLLSQSGFLIVNLKAVIQFLQGLNGTSLSQGKLEMKK